MNDGIGMMNNRLIFVLSRFVYCTKNLTLVGTLVYGVTPMVSSCTRYVDDMISQSYVFGLGNLLARLFPRSSYVIRIYVNRLFIDVLDPYLFAIPLMGEIDANVEE